MLDAALVSTDQPSLEQRWNRSVEVARVKTLVQHKGRYHTLTRISHAGGQLDVGFGAI